VLSWIRVDGFGGDEGCLPKRDARRVEMKSATSRVLLPASFAWPFSIFFWVCEGSIPNLPNILCQTVGGGVSTFLPKIKNANPTWQIVGDAFTTNLFLILFSMRYIF
jgi:hypothetical protein